MADVKDINIWINIEVVGGDEGECDYYDLTDLLYVDPIKIFVGGLDQLRDFLYLLEAIADPGFFDGEIEEIIRTVEKGEYLG